MRCIQTGDKEPVEAIALNLLGERITGLTNLGLQIRRASDRKYFDWTDNTFKSSPVQSLLTLTEIDAIGSPGEYALHSPFSGHDWGFDTNSITNPVSEDIYRMLLCQEGAPQSAANMPQINCLKVGGFIDYLDEPVSYQSTPEEIRTIIRDYGLDHLIAINPGIVPPAANTYIRQILDKEDLILSRQQIYSVQQNWAYRSADQTLFGHIWIEAQNLIVLTATACTINWCKHPTGELIFSAIADGPDSRGVFTITQVAANLLANLAYYVEAVISIPEYGTIKGIKGVFTIG